MPDRRPKPQTRSGDDRTPKTCATCGRSITWRKKWERDWEHVKFCSDGCRSHKPATEGVPDKVGTHDQELERTILDLLHQRGRDKTICPSEAARAVAGTDDRGVWEPLMEPARMAARRLVASGRIDITQQGHTVDASTAKGPIRLRLR